MCGRVPNCQSGTVYYLIWPACDVLGYVTLRAHPLFSLMHSYKRAHTTVTVHAVTNVHTQQSPRVPPCAASPCFVRAQSQVRLDNIPYAATGGFAVSLWMRTNPQALNGSHFSYLFSHTGKNITFSTVSTTEPNQVRNWEHHHLRPMPPPATLTS